LNRRQPPPMFFPDAEPSRKERGHRGVRPRHPSRSAARRAGEGSSSGPGPRRVRSRLSRVAFPGSPAW
jgi:hypothetical protein